MQRMFVSHPYMFQKKLLKIKNKQYMVKNGFSGVSQFRKEVRG